MEIAYMPTTEICKVGDTFMRQPFIYIYLFFSFFFLDFTHLFNTITLHHGQELPT